jgi:hypothetical protein
MKLAGVSYTWGRESNKTYNESAAGRLPNIAIKWPFGDRSAQLPHGINPYVDATNTTLIPGVWGGKVASAGDGDERVGAFDWRVTLKNDPNNSVALPIPKAYDPAEFELVRRAMNRGWQPRLPSFHKFSDGKGGWRPKSDWKMFGTFGEHPNAQSTNATRSVFSTSFAPILRCQQHYGPSYRLSVFVGMSTTALLTTGCPSFMCALHFVLSVIVC